ncbi:MFS transporter [Streptomyces sp. NPDC051001]|uniref:MFS transporter n=1 Tax=Streptomyces sp. NPDC051001 TaxID=3155795 RepID=UPI0034248428
MPQAVLDGTRQRPVPLRRSRNFMLLWAGQSVGELGTQLSSIAVPLLAVVELRATTLEVAVLTALGWLPYLLFSLPAGVLADRVDQRRLMVACDLARTGLMLSIPVVAAFGRLSFWFLCAVVSVTGVLTVLFSVAYRSQLPRMVSSEQLVEANGKFGVSQSLAELVGPALGGALVAAVGAARSVLGNAMTYFVSAVTLLLMDRPAKPVQKAEPVPFRAAVGEGLAFVFRHPILRPLLVCTSVSNFFAMAMNSVEILFLVRDLDASSTVVGLVFAAGSVGGLITGTLADRLAKRVGSARIIWVAMAAPGPLYLLMPLAQPGWGILLYAVGMTAFSANVVLFNATATSYRQAICPGRLLGRVNASFVWVCYGVIPLGALFGGALATGIGLRAALTVCVLGMWSACLFVIFSPLRRLRDTVRD